MARKKFNINAARDPSLPKGSAVLSADLYFLLTQGRLIFYLNDAPPKKEKAKNPEKVRSKKRKGK